jgi:hypothetical protein
MGKPRLEQFALFMLLVGSLLFPWGWLLAIVLVWSSRRWSLRDKLIATLCPPFGFVPAFYLVFGGFGYTQTCEGGMTSSGRTWEHCTGGPSPLMQVVGIIAAVVLTIMPIATAIYLNRRLSRPIRSGSRPARTAFGARRSAARG